MPRLPVLVTARLTLRPFHRDDAAEVQRLAGDWAVADTTLNMPHPYQDGLAEAWITKHEALYASGDELVLAIALIAGPDGRALRRTPVIGAIGLRFTRAHARAELGYWVGKPYWSHGYATEAARALVDHAFETLGVHRVYAQHFLRNPASGRVMQKIGMRYEGRLREHVRRWDRYEDLEVYGLLRDDWLAGGGRTRGGG